MENRALKTRGLSPYLILAAASVALFKAILQGAPVFVSLRPRVGRGHGGESASGLVDNSHGHGPTHGVRQCDSVRLEQKPP